MGMVITAKNSSYDFYMSYGGFYRLRKNIASVMDEEFGENYAKLLYCHTNEDFAENDKRANEIIEKKHLDKYADILDFLYMEDASGKIPHTTCKQIYDLIKDYDFQNSYFRYAADAHNDYEEFKNFLKECYSKRRNMQWY